MPESNLCGHHTFYSRYAEPIDDVLCQSEWDNLRCLQGLSLYAQSVVMV